MQQQLREMNFDEPAFAHHPALLGARPETLENEWFLSAYEDAEEDKGDAMSLMPAWARKRMPQGTHITCPQLIGAAEGIMPWGGSVTSQAEE